MELNRKFGSGLEFRILGLAVRDSGRIQNPLLRKICFSEHNLSSSCQNWTNKDFLENSHTEKNKRIPEPLNRGSHIHFYFLLATPKIAVLATSKQGLPVPLNEKNGPNFPFFP